MPDIILTDQHKYIVDGQERISVTSCLPYNYYKDSEKAKQKGQYIHEMIYLYNLGTLNEDNLDEQLIPYLAAYKKFRQESKDIQGVIDVKSGSRHPCVKLQIAAYVELVNNTYRGTLDFVSVSEIPLFHNIYLYTGTPDIVNSKIPVTQGYALYLKDNGSYRLDNHSQNLRRNFNIFVAFLTTHIWQKENGLL